MGSRFDCPNAEPPAWLEQFERPACFIDPRDWRSYLLSYRDSARGNELKDLRRGVMPDFCADCTAGHRHDMQRIGKCIPIKAVEVA